MKLISGKRNFVKTLAPTASWFRSIPDGGLTKITVTNVGRIKTKGERNNYRRDISENVNASLVWSLYLKLYTLNVYCSTHLLTNF